MAQDHDEVPRVCAYRGCEARQTEAWVQLRVCDHEAPQAGYVQHSVQRAEGRCAAGVDLRSYGFTT